MIISTPQPAIILVAPQLGENIGFVARAMANCALTDLRLVRPRPTWPSSRAHAAASGADSILDAAQLFDTTSEAVADLHRLWATTARRRDMVKPTTAPRRAVQDMRQAGTKGELCGILFGPERAGLDNDDVALADQIVEVPLNPEFSSLNLGQAVLLMAYEWYQSADERQAPETSQPEIPQSGDQPATRAELENYFEHLEQALDASGFFSEADRRPITVRKLRNLFLRAAPTEKEVRTLHGVVTRLSGRYLRKNKPDSSDETKER